MVASIVFVVFVVWVCGKREGEEEEEKTIGGNGLKLGILVAQC